jgi:protease-4
MNNKTYQQWVQEIQWLRDKIILPDNKRIDKITFMTTAQVDAIAQGRVWTGIDAHKLGLVDEIGGLDVAIKYAAKLGKTSSYRTENYPEYEKSFDDLLANFTGMAMFKTKKQLLKEQLGEEGFQMLEQIKRVKSRKGIQAMMPYEIEIH